MHQLNLNHLYYFWIIAKEGSVRKAAKKLHLSQPTLSDQLRTLEARLGKELFERKNNRLHLTPLGQKTLEHCTQMFIEGEKILSLVNEENKQRRNYVVGILPELPRPLVFDILLPLINLENSYVSIIQDEYRHIVQDLSGGKLDFILTTHPIPELPKTYTQKEIRFQDHIIVCNKHLYRKNLTKFFEQTPFVSYTKESSVNEIIEKYFKRKKVEIHKICEVDDLGLMKMITMKKDAFCIVPRSSVEIEIQKEQLAILDEIPNLRSSINVVYKDLEQNMSLKQLFQ